MCFLLYCCQRRTAIEHLRHLRQSPAPDGLGTESKSTEASRRLPSKKFGRGCEALNPPRRPGRVVRLRPPAPQIPGNQTRIARRTSLPAPSHSPFWLGVARRRSSAAAKTRLQIKKKGSHAPARSVVSHAFPRNGHHPLRRHVEHPLHRPSPFGRRY